MSEEMKEMLVATVLNYCKQSGLTEKEVLRLFSRKIVYGGYKILEKKIR